MSSDDVEISTRLNVDEWSEESLDTLVKTYQRDIAEMGAKPEEIKTHIERNPAGGVKIRVVWEKSDDEP